VLINAQSNDSFSLSLWSFSEFAYLLVNLNALDIQCLACDSLGSQASNREYQGMLQATKQGGGLVSFY